MAEKLSWGIIGTGNIAHAFAKAVGASDSGVLVAVGSRSQESADKFGAEFGLTHCHPTYDALIGDPDVQAIYISTPHPMHAEWAIKCSDAGKHVLCEKPFTLNYPDSMAVFEAARRNGTFTMEAFMWRCHPLAARLAEVIRSGEIGKIGLIRAPFSFNAGYNPGSRLQDKTLGGGGILDVGCYTTSMARLVAGAALGRETAEPVKLSGLGYLHPESGSDQYAAALLKFEGDIYAQISCGVALGDDNVTRIFGTNGSIVIDSPWFWSPAQFTVNVNGAEPRVETVEGDKSVYAYEVDAFAAGVAAGRAPYPAMTVEDTLGNMATLDMWRKEIGLYYDEELNGAARPTLDRKPLAKKAGVAPAMKFARVPGVDKDLSRLVMGTMLEGHILAEPHAHAIYDAFIEFGGTTFDTAHVYGNEHTFGNWLKNRKIRDSIGLLVKGAHPPECTPEGISRQLLISLEKLGTDHADVYMMHRDNTSIPVSEFVDVLNEHLQAGRINSFGGSNWSIARFEEANAYAAKKGLIGFSSISNNFSLARMVTPVWDGCISASDPESRAWFEKTQTPLFAWSSQARGFFVRGDRNFTADGDMVRNWYSDDNFERLERVQKMSKERDTSPINIACAYVLAQPFPSFALVGPRTVEEVRTTFDGLSVELSPEDLKYLNLED